MRRAGRPDARRGAALAQSGGQVSALKGHDSNAPVDVDADRIEVQDRADRAMFAGNVKARQGESDARHRAADARLHVGRRHPDPTASTPAAG